MPDAVLGLQITSAPADVAAAALDRLVAAAGRAEQAVGKLGAGDKETSVALAALARELGANTAAVAALQRTIGGLSAAQTALGVSARAAATSESSLAKAQVEARTSAAALTGSEEGLGKALAGVAASIEANTAAMAAAATASARATATNNTLAESARRAVAAEDALAAAVLKVKVAEDRLRATPPPAPRSPLGGPAGPAGAGGAAAAATGWAGLSAMGRANAEYIATNRTLVSGMAAAGKAAEETEGKIRRVGLAAHEAKMIAIQTPDIVQGVFGGQSFAQIGLQQGGQIIQSLQLGEGGLAGGLSRAAVSLGRIFTLGRVAFAGVAGGIALAAIELGRYQAAQDRLTDSLQLRGRASGLSTGGLNTIALAGAAQGGISNSAGRDIAAKFAGAGLRAPEIQGLIGDTKAFARITGDSLSDAGDNLAKMFAKPVDGAKQLAEAFGGVDFATMEMITHLEAAGRTAEAQAALFKVLDNRMKEVKDTTWTAKLVWDQFIAGIENTADRAAGAAQRVLAPSLEDQLAKARATANAPGGFMSIFTGPTTERRDEAAQRADDLSTQIEKRDRTLQAQAARDRAATTSLQAGDVLKSVVPEQTRFLALQDQITKLKDGLAGGGGLGPAAAYAQEALARLEGAVHSLTDASGKLLTNSDLATEKYNIEVAAINARTLAEKEAVAGMQAEAAARGQLLSVADQLIAKRREEALVAERAAKESRDQLRNSQDTMAGAGLLPFERAQHDITTRFRELRVAQGDSAELGAAEGLERQAAAQTAVLGPLRDANMGINAQIRLLEVQRDTFGETTDKVEAAGEAAKLWNSYIAAGIDPAKTMIDAHKSLADAIGEEAGKYGEAQLAAERLAQAQGEVKQQVQDVEGAFGDLVDVLSNDAISGKGKNIGRDLVKALGGDLLKSSIGQLKNQFNLIVEKPLTNYLSKLSGTDKLAVPEKIASSLGDRGSSAANPVWVSVVGGLPGAGGGLGLGAGGLGASPGGAITSAPLPPVGGVAQTYFNGGGPGNAFKGAVPVAATAPGNLFAGATPDNRAMAAYISQRAPAYGIDPKTALMVARSEGLAPGVWQSKVYQNGRREPSYGPFQLLKGGGTTGFPEGMGNRFQAQTGLDPADPANARAGVDFALKQASQTGWGQWYGAKSWGISNWQGIGGRPRNPLANVPGAVGTPFGVSPQAAGAPVVDTAAIDRATQSLQKVAQASTTLSHAAQPVAPALNTSADAFSNLGSSLGSIGGAVGAKSGNSALGSGLGSILGMLMSLVKLADGGVMGSRGPIPLRHYAGGGVASSPQLAVFGEGSEHEAFIPLKGGGVPVRFTNAPAGVARRAASAAALQTRDSGGPTRVTHDVRIAIDLSGANGDAAIEDAAQRGAHAGAAMAYARVFRDLPRRLQASAAEGRTRY